MLLFFLLQNNAATLIDTPRLRSVRFPFYFTTGPFFTIVA